MTEKKKIILFYVGIGVFCALLIFGFVLLGELRTMRAEANHAKYSGVVKNVQIQELEESIGQNRSLILTEDFTAVNQFDEEVTFQSLKGKVWVFAQFYGSCPECNSTNLSVLKELFEKYKDNPNFQIVTISVKPEKDAVTLMKAMADHYAPGAKNWWFISADAKEVNQFCQDHMGYMAFRKNEDFGKVVEGSDSTELEILHDMRISVFGAEMGQWAVVDIANPMKDGDTLRTELARKRIDGEIQFALDKIR